MNALTKTTICGGAAISCSLILAAVPRPLALPQQSSVDRQVHGTVTELWVNAPGRVQFRLHGTDEKGKAATLWFETPSDKDTNTLLENLALSLIRYSLESGLDLLVESKDSSGDDGTVATKAFSIVRIGVRPQPQGEKPR